MTTTGWVRRPRSEGGEALDVPDDAPPPAGGVLEKKWGEEGEARPGRETWLVFGFALPSSKDNC